MLAKITPRTRAVFLTHVLGYNALSRRLLDELRPRGIPLLEDVCESHGATFEGRKLGTFGLASNFSFYYAHHLSTIEGGMVCTNDAGLLRDACACCARTAWSASWTPTAARREYADEYPDLNPDFIFALPGYNVRSTEINAVIGRSQLKRLDDGNPAPHREPAPVPRQPRPGRVPDRLRDRGEQQLRLHADPAASRTPALCQRVMATLRAHGVEFRRGTAGGGNQVRQPYLRRLLGAGRLEGVSRRPTTSISTASTSATTRRWSASKILRLCELLNDAGRVAACGCDRWRSRKRARSHASWQANSTWS